MNLKHVIDILEEEKWEIIKDLEVLRKEKRDEMPIDRVFRRLVKDDSIEDNINYYERLIEEITEALRILRLSESTEG